VDLFADDWGVDGSEGACVWFELSRAAEAREAGTA
jgi:hypothetical protein